ncbi:antitoxin [Phenylobacterium aquaticum]|uniref:antitoxin n=1 Tax=Phenylobacterium aquaticum TaxID=1763816 RepID=UPI001F5D8FE9|nr:AbrB/MazE/SpoVT family DNA-binding domain-containing protein [Phenylobacterium aquaticum]
MGSHQKAKLFTHGGSQAVRLPKAFRFEGVEVRIHKEGDRVILEPVRPDFSSLWAELDHLGGEPFPDRAAQPEPPAAVDFDT